MNHASLNLSPDASPTVAWLIAGATTALLLGLLLALRRELRRRYRAMQDSERTEILELPFCVLSRTSTAFLAAVTAYVGLALVQLSPRVEGWLGKAVALIAFWQLGIWCSAAFTAWLDRKRRRSLERDRSLVGPIGIIGIVARGVIWTLVVLLSLDNFGVNVTALVAGLGIGGVAVALALQNILGDLFASLAIALDQPFVVGDFLVVGDVMGTVENIGIKSTRLRSLGGEQAVISNADLLSSRVRNFQRMSERRVQFVLDLTYDTPADRLVAALAVVRQIVEGQAGIRLDRCHFAGFGDHSLKVECVYYVLSSDYNRHMDLLQRVNLAILREFTQMGVSFAYPTRTVHVAQAREDRAPPVHRA